MRTAAAVAALDTTGPRDDLLAHLVTGATRGDRLTKELARIGVARVAPQHNQLRRAVGQPSPLTGRDRPSHTAVLTHGTFASGLSWWRPGGDFYTYLDSLVPPLKLHDHSFSWSGMYSDGARQLAAQQLVNWVPDQNLQRPDFFAHSHGGDRSVPVLVEAIMTGPGSAELVTVLASIGTKAARDALARVRRTGPPSAAATAAEALRTLDETPDNRDHL